MLTAIKQKSYNQQYALSIRGRAKKLWHRAKKRNADCEITEAWIIKKLIQGHCELSGLPFDLTPSTRHRTNPYAPSLDRINSDIKNYTPENTRLVLASVNLALNEFGTDIMLPILKAMVDTIEKPDANR